jgi:hypothetical protein
MTTSRLPIPSDVGPMPLEYPTLIFAKIATKEYRLLKNNPSGLWYIITNIKTKKDVPVNVLKSLVFRISVRECFLHLQLYLMNLECGRLLLRPI